jgi:hypothetical protein
MLTILTNPHLFNKSALNISDYYKNNNMLKKYSLGKNHSIYLRNNNDDDNHKKAIIYSGFILLSISTAALFFYKTIK